MNRTVDELTEKLVEAQRLLESMTVELHFRGADDNHKLIRRATELRSWIQRMGRLE